ncbi:beta-N-acetylhexosaminidase [Pedobacter cryoconitis]|uniref:beta-N-acetylhexosaminidase n=1 Tax=Pedobacter cryoconitis TaxID=188932 RepID=A0A7X0MHX3_9SPHI|nr:beta-N-acetylhexosaminidase [Pedobacter cryoconitis]MBB6499579.1 hexosaminidase [Pedobacter cryoconitis]
MKKRFLILVTACLLLSYYPVSAQTEPLISPRPLAIQMEKGSFRLDASTQIIASKQLKTEADYLKTKLQTSAGLTLSVNNASPTGKNKLALLVDAKQLPEFGKEGYQLIVNTGGIKITAADKAGLFYGMQSLLQLINQGDNKLEIPLLTIKDKPRFSWRALMLDEGRHFKGEKAVKQLLDDMAMLKMNVFHWHLTDDQGWRIEIKKYPELTKVGSKRKDSQTAWRSEKREGQPHEGFYTQAQIKNIVQYAAERHITVVPEIEMPGHASAAIASYPWLGTTGEKIEVPVTFGKFKDTYNVADPKVYTFLEDVLTEVMALFPSKVIHIGGDEVLYDQWKASPQVKALMVKENLKTPADVQIWFTNKISKFIASKGRRMMGWNEIMGGKVHEFTDDKETAAKEKLDQGTIVHFWKGTTEMVTDAASKGYDVVNSYHIYTYLDYDYKEIPIRKAYEFNPIPEGLDPKYDKHVLGLGCQMWGEFIPTEASMQAMIYPRLAAYAEVGWTDLSRKDYTYFKNTMKLIENHWKAEGIQVESADYDALAK